MGSSLAIPVMQPLPSVFCVALVARATTALPNQTSTSVSDMVERMVDAIGGSVVPDAVKGLSYIFTR